MTDNKIILSSLENSFGEERHGFGDDELEEHFKFFSPDDLTIMFPDYSSGDIFMEILRRDEKLPERSRLVKGYDGTGAKNVDFPSWMFVSGENLEELKGSIQNYALRMGYEFSSEID